MLNFKDFAEEAVLDGEKVHIDSILNQDITVLAYGTRSSRYTKCNNGNYLIIQFELKQKRHVIFTASGVLHEQLVKYQNNLPFMAQIAKISSYYTFV